MAEYCNETWVEIYQRALMELEHAKMRGRIGDARIEIVARVERLKSIQSLHAQEDQALGDALNALKFLEREEDGYDENQRRETLAAALQKLHSLAPTIERLDSASDASQTVTQPCANQKHGVRSGRASSRMNK
jgi:hypothetical protein